MSCPLKSLSLMVQDVLPTQQIYRGYRGSNFIIIIYTAHNLENFDHVSPKASKYQCWQTYFLGVPNIPDASGPALALWLSFVPFLIRLYLSSYMAPILLLMSQWSVVLDFYKFEETYSGQDSQMFFGWFPSQHVLSLFWYISGPWN